MCVGQAAQKLYHGEVVQILALGKPFQTVFDEGYAGVEDLKQLETVYCFNLFLDHLAEARC